MARVNYIACPSCEKEYYIDRILSEALETNPGQNLKCPFCKQTFTLPADAKGGADAKPRAGAQR